MIAEIISFIAGAALASVIVGFCKAGKDINDTGNIVTDRQAGACN